MLEKPSRCTCQRKKIKREKAERGGWVGDSVYNHSKRVCKIIKFTNQTTLYTARRKDAAYLTIYSHVDSKMHYFKPPEA